MKKLPILRLFITSLLLVSCVTTKPKPSDIKEKLLEQEAWRHELPQAATTPVRPNFPKVFENKLANGLTILVVEDSRLPIVDAMLFFRNGSALDPIGKAGLENLTALMLKEGTAALSSLELAERFADLGTEVSVGAGKDSSYISVGILSDKIDDALGLISAMAQKPRMSSDDFARVKTQQQHAINSDMASPGYVAQVKFLHTAYGDKHPYGYPSAGTNETLSRITLADVKKAHSTDFGLNNAALVVVGDVTRNQIYKTAEKYFGEWRKEIKDPVKAIEAPPQHERMQTVLISRPSLPQTFLLIGQPAATQHDHDLASYEVFQNIVAGMPTSRLGSILRERKGWTYGVYSVLSPLRGKGPLLFTTSIEVPHGADALKIILDQFETMKHTPVTSQELQDAKSGILNSYASQYTTLRKIASSIGENFIYNLPKNHDEIIYDNIAKVTSDMIMAVAQKALPKNQMTAVAVGELEVMEIPLATMDVGKVTVDKD
jgi:zinc protease